MDTPFYVDFDSAVYDTDPTFTNIPQARSVDVARGRTSELDKVGTGTVNVGTIDLTGDLDPTNTTGPWYGKLDPVKQARISIVNPVKLLNDDDDTTYNLFTGYVQKWGDFEVSQDGGRIEGNVALVDALDLFANARLMPGHGDPKPGAVTDIYFAGGPNGYSAGTFKHVDQRIVDLLDLLGFPGIGAFRDGLKRDVFSGNVSELEQVYARADEALAVLDDAADSELPFVATRFMTKDGVFAFRGRFARFFPATLDYGINFWRLGGLQQARADHDVAVISRLPAFGRDANDIINAAIAVPSGADVNDVPGNLVTDPTSIAKFGYRSRDTPNLLTYQGHTDGTPTNAIEETKKMAQYRVGNYKDPITRIGEVEMVLREPRDPLAAAQWDFICRAELSDVVTLTTTHPGGGGFDDVDFFLEGIRLNMVPAPPPKFYEITATLDLSPRELYDYNPFGTVDNALT